MNKKIWLPALVIAVLIVGIFSFKREKTIEIPAPVSDGAYVPEIPPEISQISVKVDVPIGVIEEYLNQNVPKRFEGTQPDPTGNFLSEDNLYWGVNIGKIEVFPQGPHDLGFRVPFTDAKASIRGTFGAKRRNKGPLGWFEELFSESVSETVEVGGTIEGMIRPELNPDWTVNPNVSLSVNVSKAEFDLVGRLFQFSVRTLLENEVNDALSEVIGDFNKSIAQNRALQQQVQKIWDELHYKTEVYETPPSWVTMVPVALGSSDLNIIDNNVSISLGTHVKGSVFINHEPEIAITPLPNMSRPTVSSQFSFAVPVALSLDQLTGALPDDIVAYDPIETPVGTITIKNAFVSGHDGQLFLGADIIGDKGWFEKIEATLYFTGQPVLDKEAQLLRVENLDYDLVTKEKLIGIADWLLEPAILTQLQKAAVFDIGSVTEEVKARSVEEIEKLRQQLGDDQVDLNLKLENLSVADLFIDNNWVVFVVKCDGPASVRVNNLMVVN